MKLNDFLKTDLLGNKFCAVKGFSEVLDRETQQLVAYRVNISLQSEESPFFMEMIQVKINNISPSISAEDMAKNKTREVILKDLTVGQYNGNLWFSASDILPVKQA